jgi:hypothetical protein
MLVSSYELLSLKITVYLVSVCKNCRQLRISHRQQPLLFRQFPQMDFCLYLT